jgi:phosphoribosylglycinamide formyltransferase-1
VTRVPVGVLISGSGTNLGALLAATQAPDHPARIAVVISNRPDAGGLERARVAGVPAEVAPHRAHADRHAYDTHLAARLQAHGVRWVCLAGFMRIVGPALIDAFEGRVLNVHPALLPAFPGLHAQRQALEHGVKVAGATVHLVDSGTDTGPIVAQEAVPVLPHDDEAALSARILAVEHRIYPAALRWAVEGRLRVEGRICTVT